MFSSDLLFAIKRDAYIFKETGWYLLILFRYSPISCSQKLPQNVAKNLKTVKIEKKNKTKQNKKKKKTQFFLI